MGLTHTSRSHKQQPPIDRRIIEDQATGVKKCFLLVLARTHLKLSNEQLHIWQVSAAAPRSFCARPRARQGRPLHLLLDSNYGNSTETASQTIVLSERSGSRSSKLCFRYSVKHCFSISCFYVRHICEKVRFWTLNVFSAPDYNIRVFESNSK